MNTSTPATAETLGVREQTKLRRPGEIINAAYEEFVQNGYAATRLEDVAKRIGVTKGTIYIYFQSKEELFRAVIGSLMTPILDRAAEFTATFSGTCTELLRQHIANLYNAISAEPRGVGLLRLLIAEGEKFPELMDFYHREVSERAVKIIADILAQGIERGEFCADAPVNHPHIFMAPVMMAAMHKMMSADALASDENVSDAVTTHLDLLISSLRPGARPSSR